MNQPLAAMLLLLPLSPAGCTHDRIDLASARATEAPSEPEAAAPPETSEFNQWRGPRRDGHLGGVEIPGKLPESLKEVWRVTVGEGHATPVIGGDRIYVLARQGEEEVALCLRFGDGSEVWRYSYPAPYEMSQVARAHGKGPKSTPIVHDGRLYTFGISGILTCIDAESGEKRWQKSFGAEFSKTSPLYGTATSPIVDGDLVIAHVGGHDRGAVRAFDRRSGAVRWSWADDGPAYTSPIVAKLAGERQLVTQSQNYTLGISITDGRLLWKLPFKTPYDQNIVTPVLYGDTIICSGLNQGTSAIRIAKKGGSYETETIWHSEGVSMYMSSPVLVGGALFGMAHQKKGQLVCLDAKSGDVRWRSDGRLGDNVALVHAASRLWALTNGARLVVFRPDPERYAPEAEYDVADSPTWAHPVLTGGSVLIKDLNGLARFDL